MKKILALTLALVLALSLCACGGGNADTTTTDNGDAADTATVEIPPVEDLTGTDTSAIPGVEDGVLTVGMECTYAPYNWTQTDDSNGAVPIVNNPGSYANGYDVMIAQRICDTYGWKLEVQAIEWAGLIPALNAGTIDAVIAGQSMTTSRMEQVDMAGPYFYASIVCVAKKDSEQAKAKGISELTGTCTAQEGTIWYTDCLPQVEGAQIMAQSESAPAMIMAVESGTVDFICTDMPTAQGAVAAYPDMKILDFSGTEGDFQFDDAVRAENVNIGISLMKGNTVLKEKIDAVLSTMTVDDFNALMEQAIAIQPLSED